MQFVTSLWHCFAEFVEGLAPLRHSYDAKAWQWFPLGTAQLSQLDAMVAQRTTDADSLLHL